VDEIIILVIKIILDIIYELIIQNEYFSCGIYI